MVKIIKKLELIETEHEDTIYAHEDFDEKTVKHILFVDKINEIIEAINKLNAKK